MNLSKSIEDYLEAIYTIELKGLEIHSNEIADILSISRPAVTQAMTELVQKGYVEKKSYGAITLTPSGREIGQKVYNRHIKIKEYLLLIGVDEKNAEVDCCKIEHVISEKTFTKIEQQIKRLK